MEIKKKRGVGRGKSGGRPSRAGIGTPPLTRAQTSFIFRLCPRQVLSILKVASQSKIRAAMDGCAVRVLLKALSQGIEWCRPGPAPISMLLPMGAIFF